jgi:hypothetical protein
MAVMGRFGVLDYSYWILEGTIRLAAKDSTHLYLVEKKFSSLLYFIYSVALSGVMVESGPAGATKQKVRTFSHWHQWRWSQLWVSKCKGKARLGWSIWSRQMFLIELLIGEVWICQGKQHRDKNTLRFSWGL